MRVLDRIRRGSYIRAWLAIGRILFLGKIIMSVPKLLYSYSVPALQQPLLPAAPPHSITEINDMSTSKRSEASNYDFSDIHPAIEAHSFTSEAFHRFGNVNDTAGGAKLRQQEAASNWAGGSDSDGLFSGGIDANSDPEVAAYVQKARSAAETGYGEEPELDLNYSITRNTSGASSAIINCDPGDKVYYKHDKERTKFEEATLYVREGELNDKFYSHPTGRWSKIAYKILHHPIFHIFDLTLSILLMLLALIEKPPVFGTESDEQPLVNVHGIFEILILGLLGVDIVLRLIWLSPKHFLQHRRTMFITIMLCVMSLEALVVLIRQESHVRVTRALRPVFFIDTYLMFGVRRVLRQIFQSLRVIVDVILLLLFVVAFFSLIAYYLFAEVDHTYFETFSLSFVSLFITTTTANNPDVMMEAYSQVDASPIFFFIYLVLTLYFVSNILFAVVYSNFAEEEKDKFRKLFLHKREALRHAYRVLCGPTGINFHDFLIFMQHYRPRIPEWQVMCVFKALHANPNDTHSELSDKEFYDFYEVQNLKWRQVTALGEDVLWFEGFPPTIKKIFFLKIYAVVKWEWFNSIIYLVIVANMVFLILYTAFITDGHKEERFKRLNIVLPISILFLLVYIVENILKILALGPRDYFKKFWNLCDFFVLFVSLIAVCLEFNPLYHSLAVVRPIKLIRVVRLKKRYRDIMNTLVVLTPRLISVFFLLLIIYYFFAIIGMESFSGKVYEGCCQNASYGIGQYYSDSTGNVSSPNVYYLNNFDNLLRSYSTLFILMVVNNWYIIMEGFASEVSHHWPARIYFISFYIVTLVVLQVVIAFIVEAFVLQLEQENRRKLKQRKVIERNIAVSRSIDDTDCVEDEHRKKEVRITLLSEDISKLRYETTYIDELSQREPFSFDRFVRRFRQIKLTKHTHSGMQCSGRRLRTNDDLHLLKFRVDIQQWIHEQDAAFRQVESSSPSANTPFKTKLIKNAKKVITYLLE